MRVSVCECVCMFEWVNESVCVGMYESVLVYVSFPLLQRDTAVISHTQ